MRFTMIKLIQKTGKKIVSEKNFMENNKKLDNIRKS